MSIWKRIFGSNKVTTTPWADVAASTAEPLAIRRPINIKRTMFSGVRHLIAGDSLTVKLSGTDVNGNWYRETAPEFEIERTVHVDYITKFEVIDEFGLDVGIGFVLGQVKR